MQGLPRYGRIFALVEKDYPPAKNTLRANPDFLGYNGQYGGIRKGVRMKNEEEKDWIAKLKKFKLSHLLNPSSIVIGASILACMLALSDPWQGFDHFLTSGLIYFGLMFVVFIVISPLLFPIALAIGAAEGIFDAFKSKSD